MFLGLLRRPEARATLRLPDGGRKRSATILSPWRRTPHGATRQLCAAVQGRCRVLGLSQVPAAAPVLGAGSGSGGRVRHPARCAATRLLRAPGGLTCRTWYMTNPQEPAGGATTARCRSDTGKPQLGARWNGGPTRRLTEERPPVLPLATDGQSSARLCSKPRCCRPPRPRPRSGPCHRSERIWPWALSPTRGETLVNHSFRMGPDRNGAKQQRAGGCAGETTPRSRQLGLGAVCAII